MATAPRRLLGPFRALLRAALAGLLLATRLPSAAAQSGIQVLAAPAPTYDFGSSISFELSVASAAPITSATLFVNTGGLTPAVWHSAPFAPAQQVTTTVSFDL